LVPNLSGQHQRLDAATEVAKEQKRTTGQSLRALGALGASKALYFGPGTSKL